MPDTTITTVEAAMLTAVADLGLFATVESAGRHEIPDTYAYPAAFAYFDGDDEVTGSPRPIDNALFKVVLQAVNLAGEDQAAQTIYELNDVVRATLRGKTLGLDMEPLACLSRKLTDYRDDEGMIEYTHTYRTRLYQPVPIAD